ncbi:MAG: glycyl-radical enzyme activating protein [Bacteroidales bacterium]
MFQKGIIFNIQRFSVNDGPGIRTTVFMKGCPLSCWWCHNPESRNFGIENLNEKDIGKEYSVEELMREILKDRVFYDESGGGVTFSGGEPLSQPVFLDAILAASQKDGIHTTVDTTGYSDKAVIEKIIAKTDLFLYDLKLIDHLGHMKYTGVSNKMILKNLEYLIGTNANVLIRIPMIPGMVATDDNLERIREFLKRYRHKVEINLLPYHKIAKSKYEKYGLKYQVGEVLELSEVETSIYFDAFVNSGFNVKMV